MTDWISVKDKLPKRADAGRFREVVVLIRDDVPALYWRGRPQLLPYHQVRKSQHSHWMPLPDPP